LAESKPYDEAEIASCLTVLPPEGRALFACGCAERLMASFRWFCDLSGCAGLGAVRVALDAAWAGPGAGNVESGTASHIARLVPDDYAGELALGSAVAQNAVACVAYALEVRQTGQVQQAVWAARQVYEAADSVVQQGSAEQSYAEDIDREPPVRLMVRGIYSVLDAIHDGVSSTDLIFKARQDGDDFLAFVNGTA
jgi:Protein of unknown function (DUF416)